MAYKSEAILANIETALKLITVANGYDSAVGTDSVFRVAIRPEENEIDIDVRPLLYVIHGPWSPTYQKSLIQWEFRPIVFGLIDSTITTASADIVSLVGDVVKVVGNNPTWPVASVDSAYDTRIERITPVGEFTKPHAAFDMELVIKYEAEIASP